MGSKTLGQETLQSNSWWPRLIEVMVDRRGDFIDGRGESDNGFDREAMEDAAVDTVEKRRARIVEKPSAKNATPAAMPE